MRLAFEKGEYDALDTNFQLRASLANSDRTRGQHPARGGRTSGRRELQSAAQLSSAAVASAQRDFCRIATATATVSASSADFSPSAASPSAAGAALALAPPLSPPPSAGLDRCWSLAVGLVIKAACAARLEAAEISRRLATATAADAPQRREAQLADTVESTNSVRADAIEAAINLRTQQQKQHNETKQ